VSTATSRQAPPRPTLASPRRAAIPIAVGDTLGDWQVLACAESTDGNHSRWLCRCSCGKERTIRGSSLRYGSGRCITCSRMAKPKEQRGGGRRPMHMLLHDRAWLDEQYVAKQRTCQDIALEVGCTRRTVGKALSRCGIQSRPPGSGYEAPEVVCMGERFGRLLVVARYEGVRCDDKRVYLCDCDCGSIDVAVPVDRLRGGVTESCGCLHREVTSAARRTHGLTGSIHYRRWVHMRARCTDPNDPSYPDYGGRGIRVCEQWQSSFDAFLNDSTFAVHSPADAHACWTLVISRGVGAHPRPG